MAQFKTAYESHSHSKKTLDILYGYDAFLDSLEVVADFGCGLGLDTEWWAKLETRDDPPEPRNYLVYSIDKKISRMDNNIKNLLNVHTFDDNFDGPHFELPKPVDLIWSHDSFQYVTDPIGTLKNWNRLMNLNGMLLLIFPQAQHYAYNRLQVHSYNNVYFNHNIVNLIYMLAVNGFDCNDAYFYKEENSPWLHAAVYKSNIAPMDASSTTWYQLAEMNLLNESVVDCLTRYGYIKQDEIITNWLDKDFYFPKE